MRIAVDAMGSDNAPDVEIEGAVAASLEGDTEILLVGDEAVLAEKLDAHPKRGAIRIVHASEAITMEDSPTLAVRQKRDSSLLVAMRLVKNGEADAIVSAGNTGAVHVGARRVLGPPPRDGCSCWISAPTWIVPPGTFASSPRWAMPSPATPWAWKSHG